MIHLIIVILWGFVGGLDWFFDFINCFNSNWFSEINNYLQTIAELETKLEHTKDILEGTKLELVDHDIELKHQRKAIHNYYNYMRDLLQQIKDLEEALKENSYYDNYENNDNGDIEDFRNFIKNNKGINNE